jgi:hypothetical protein
MGGYRRVEGRIEGEVLGKVRERLSARMDHTERDGVVDGSQRETGAEFLQGIVVDDGGGRKVVAAVDEAVADAVNRNRVMLDVLEDGDGGLSVALDTEDLLLCSVAKAVLDERRFAALHADAVSLSGKDGFEILRRGHVEYLEGQRGAAAVEDEGVQVALPKKKNRPP